jgi:hypothetical protein
LAGHSGDVEYAEARKLDLSPLMVAASRGAIPVFDLLFAQYSDTEINATDNDGFTTLVHAVNGSKLEVVKRILGSGRRIDINLVLPLFWAAQPFSTDERFAISKLPLEQPGVNPHQGPRNEGGIVVSICQALAS